MSPASLHISMAFAALLGLMVGSFLNVVILRLPTWLHHQWTREACEILEQAPPSGEVDNLAFPASHCPSCRHPLHWWHNIPLLSFVLLRGRCGFCGVAISWQYPIVETFNALWWALCISQAQGDWSVALWWSLWGSTLLTLAWIDAQTMLLPDVLTQALLWAALLWAALGWGHVPSSQAILGAVMGYGLLWLPAQLYLRVTGRVGMAPGDFKLLAAIGASFGPLPLPMIMLTASLLGLLFAAWHRWRTRGASAEGAEPQAIPFGPALAGAALLAHGLGPSFGLEWFT